MLPDDIQKYPQINGTQNIIHIWMTIPLRKDLIKIMSMCWDSVSILCLRVDNKRFCHVSYLKIYVCLNITLCSSSSCWWSLAHVYFSGLSAHIKFIYFHVPTRNQIHYECHLNYKIDIYDLDSQPQHHLEKLLIFYGLGY